MAHSASSLLAVVLALIMSAVYAASRRGLASAVICAIVSIGSVVLVAGTAGGDISTLFNLLDRDPSLTGRTELWDYVGDAIRERPVFGWGYMAFWTPDSRNATYIQNQIGWPAPNAHDGYLELTLSLGLVGLAGFVVTALWAVKRIVISIMQKNDLGALLLIMSTQLLVANLTESFMISASVFGWNVFSIFALKASAEARPTAGLIGSPPTTLLDRAKIRA
jgi:O-antigen ligase